MKLLYLYFTLINLAAFIMMGLDKYRACRHRWRIPERTLLGIALFGGSLGTFLGMLLFRHKIRTGIFMFGIPALLLLHLILVFLIF